jgi:hypothetical protein
MLSASTRCRALGRGGATGRRAAGAPCGAPPQPRRAAVVVRATSAPKVGSKDLLKVRGSGGGRRPPPLRPLGGRGCAPLLLRCRCDPCAHAHAPASFPQCQVAEAAAAAGAKVRGQAWHAATAAAAAAPLPASRRNGARTQPSALTHHSARPTHPPRTWPNPPTQVITEALDKPRNIKSKGAIGDIVTDTGGRPGGGGVVSCGRLPLRAAGAGAAAGAAAARRPSRPSRRRNPANPGPAPCPDRAAEEAALAVIRGAFPGHAVLGEEGGVAGDVGSEYLWCIDPLDGTCNFAHGYRGGRGGGGGAARGRRGALARGAAPACPARAPAACDAARRGRAPAPPPGFCCSIGVLRHSTPVAGCVIEFAGGPGAWSTVRFMGVQGKAAGAAQCQMWRGLRRARPQGASHWAPRTAHAARPRAPRAHRPYSPQLTYSAARNFGATVNGRPLSVSGTKKLEDALVVRGGGA